MYDLMPISLRGGSTGLETLGPEPGGGGGPLREAPFKGYGLGQGEGVCYGGFSGQDQRLELKFYVLAFIKIAM
jgi:hypothetical protein